MNAFAVRPSSGSRPWLLIQFEGTFEHPYREFTSREAAEVAARELNNWFSPPDYGQMLEDAKKLNLEVS